MPENLHKSDAGWERLRSNVKARRGIRAAHMEHRPRSAFKAKAGKPRLDRTHVVRDQAYDAPEIVAISVCGLCAEAPGRCSGACLVE